MNGRKFFVSLVGCTPGTWPRPRSGWAMNRGSSAPLYLQGPGDAPGVSLLGDWDPMGMRGTVSRDMVAGECVRVLMTGEAVLPGLFGAMYTAFPHLFLDLLRGLSRADAGRPVTVPSPQPDRAHGGGAGPHASRMAARASRSPKCSSRSRPLARSSIGLIFGGPGRSVPRGSAARAGGARDRAEELWSGLTQEAIRIGGGRAFLKRYPLERYARDARAAALMRPWTEEIAVQQAWEAAFGPATA